MSSRGTHLDFLFLNPIGDIEVTNIHMLRPLTTRRLSIDLHQYAALVVLQDYDSIAPIALGDHKLATPQHERQTVTHRHYLSFRQTSYVQLVTFANCDGKSLPHR